MKKDLKNIPFHELVDKHMPLLLTDAHGEYTVWDDWVDMYYNYILQLRRKNPGGYIDFALHLVEEFDYTATEAAYEVQYCQQRHKLRDPELVCWDMMEAEDVEALQRIVMSRHYVLDTVFQLSYFNEAIELYRQNFVKKD